jgi:dipeptidyl aminopeptidase/acylaminoacyl peptidase
MGASASIVVSEIVYNEYAWRETLRKPIRHGELLLKTTFVGALCALTLCGRPVRGVAQEHAGPFSVEQLLGYPYPSELAASATKARLAWVFDERGIRNVWVAEGPDFVARKLTRYRVDDGQELTNVSLSRDGQTVVYVRGGDHDANWEEDQPPDPASTPTKPKVEIWSVPFNGGTPKLLAEGDQPVISPRGDRVAYIGEGGIWAVPLDGSAAGQALALAKGKSSDLQWSPDGSRLAFVSDRDDHSFIAVFSGDSTPLRYLSPSTSRDLSPRWSPDGKQLAFVRIPGEGGAPQVPLFGEHPLPWAIWTADASTGAAHRVWQSPKTSLGSYPETDGETNLNWVAGDRLVFLTDLDGWPHLYSTSVRDGASPLLLTPGRFMVEFVRMSLDRKSLVYAANTGNSPSDLDRRHIFEVPVDRAEPVALTAGDGIEWSPVAMDGGMVGYVGAGPRKPPLPMVLSSGTAPRPIGANRIPDDFPQESFVIPRPISFRSADRVEAHGQLFEPVQPDSSSRRPAIIFVHGGPPRQMLLGWHYMDYYSTTYAVNQYFASRGYVVLALNYRLGIGYGHRFHHPDNAGPNGAAEYRDVKAAAEYLRRMPGVDPRRIGIWGGSYGGYLGALALARNSDLFAAGVDLHGVHDWTSDLATELASAAARYEHADVERARTTAWQSSPVAWIKGWKSPVLLIHGDDDRNVRFQQTVDLARRLDDAGVRYEEMVLPDEIHGFLRYATWVQVVTATTRFFDRVLAPVKAEPPRATQTGSQ